MCIEVALKVLVTIWVTEARSNMQGHAKATCGISCMAPKERRLAAATEECVKYDAPPVATMGRDDAEIPAVQDRR